jgi:type IV pilus assembly protein PilA
MGGKKMLKKFLKNDKGLTLVELLAVIVILGIIAAIAVPSIGGIIDKSKDDAKVAEAIQIINAAKLAHASDSATITWKNADLKDYLSSVDDTSYTVDYDATSKEYSITGHAASKPAGKANNAKITEEELTTAAQ